MKQAFLLLTQIYAQLCKRFSWLHNFVLYAVIGLLAAVLDYAVFWSLKQLAGFAPELASLCGNMCGFLFTFSGNTFYNFKKSTHVLFRFISYFSITIGGMTLSTLLLYYGKELMNIYVLKAVLVLFVIPMIQFVLNKKITYRDFSAGDTGVDIVPGKWWSEKSFLQKFFVLFLIFSAVMWVVVPSTYHTTLHFDPAETLMWGSSFNWGSAKHPPVSGIMLFHFCKLFGFKNFAIYLLSQLCVTIGFIYIYKLSRCFFDRDNSVIAVLLITFYFFYNYETPKFNANIPHLLFVPMMVYYFYRGCAANKWHHWLLLAVSGAGAFLSKYSAGVLAVSFVLYFIADRNARKCLLTVKPYAAAIFSCVLLIPHIQHLISTDFLVFNYINHGKAVKYGYFMQLIILLAALAAPLFCMSAAACAVYFGGERKFPSLKNFKLTVYNPAAAKYSLCIVGGQAAFLLFMGICGHRLLTIWTYPLFLTAGILIMSFFPVPVNLRSKKVFAVLVSAFGMVMLLIPLTHYNFSSKYRYHISKEKLHHSAQEFYQQQTGKDVPFIIGDIWHAAMLQNTFKYRVNACPSSDPILIGLHRQHIAENGALIITAGPRKTGEEINKMFGISPVWHQQELSYRARFGKNKTYKYFFAVLPPAAVNQDKKP